MIGFILPNLLSNLKQSTSWRGHQRKQDLKRANGGEALPFQWGYFLQGLDFYLHDHWLNQCLNQTAWLPNKMFGKHGTHPTLDKKWCDLSFLVV